MSSLRNHAAPLWISTQPNFLNWYTYATEDNSHNACNLRNKQTKNDEHLKKKKFCEKSNDLCKQPFSNIWRHKCPWQCMIECCNNSTQQLSYDRAYPRPEMSLLSIVYEAAYFSHHSLRNIPAFLLDPSSSYIHISHMFPHIWRIYFINIAMYFLTSDLVQS